MYSHEIIVLLSAAIIIWNDTETCFGKFKIIFNANGGSACTTILKKFGETVNLPKTTKKGNTFGGWFKKETLENEWTEDTNVTGDQKLYAKWTVNSYAIKFITNCSTTFDDIIVEYNGTIPPLPSGNKMTKKGYTFVCWLLDVNDSKCFNASTTTMPDHDITLTAKWKENDNKKEGGLSKTAIISIAVSVSVAVIAIIVVVVVVLVLMKKKKNNNAGSRPLLSEDLAN